MREEGNEGATDAKRAVDCIRSVGRPNGTRLYSITQEIVDLLDLLELLFKVDVQVF